MNNSHSYTICNNFRVYIAFFILTISFLYSPAVWSQADSSFYYTNKLLKQSPTRNDSLKTCISFMKYWQNNSNYKNITTYAEMGLKLAFSLGDSTSVYVGDAYTGLGIACMRTMKSGQALDYFIKAEKILTKDPYRLAVIRLQRGLLFYFNQDYVHALEIFRDVEKKAVELKKTNLEALALMDIGNIFFERYQPDSALKYYTKSLGTPKELSDSVFYMGLYMNIGNVYSSIEKHKEAKPYLLKAFELVKKYNRKSSLPIITYNLASVEFYLKENPKAAEHLAQSIKYAKLINDNRNLLYAYKFKLRLDSAMGLKDSFYKDFVVYNNLSDTLHNSELYGKMAEMQTKFDVNKKDDEIILLNKDKALQNEKLQKQRIITALVLIGLLVFTILSIVLFRNYRAKKKANYLLELKNNEVSKQKTIIENQKHIVEEHQKEIIDSINYAKRIQYSLLASDSLLKKYLPEYFVLFSPKDIVSGDFYWVTEYKNDFYLAVCDSTGHGVPGAFMSILNIGFLSEAIKEKGITKPHEILNYVRARLIETISKEGQKDGMDCVVIKLESKNSGFNIEYAAANNQPVLLRNGEIIELDKDRMPVGKGEKTDDFILHTIELQKGDSLILYTDGYADQFGGEKGKKFKYKPLNELLLVNQHKSCNEQKEILNNVFDKWKGSLEQVDDVTIIGIKI